MIKLVIFDLDGTLVNSLHDLADAVNFALENNGYPKHDLSEFNYLVGNGVNELIRKSLPSYVKDSDCILKVKSDFNLSYTKNFLNNTTTYDGIQKLLSDLKKNEILLAVASNKPDEFVQKIINELFYCLFDYACGFKEDIPRKPSPEIVYKILHELNINAEETIFIGDSDVDINTAKNSGLKSVGCLWGYRTADELISSGADYIADTPHNIIKFIEKENEYELQY